MLNVMQISASLTEYYIPCSDLWTPLSGGWFDKDAALRALREMERDVDVSGMGVEDPLQVGFRLSSAKDWQQPVTHLKLIAEVGCEAPYKQAELAAMAAAVIRACSSLGADLKDVVDFRIAFQSRTPQANAHFDVEANLPTDYWTSATFSVEGPLDNVLVAARACGSTVRWYGPRRGSCVRTYATPDEAVAAHKKALGWMPNERDVLSL